MRIQRVSIVQRLVDEIGLIRLAPGGRFIQRTKLQDPAAAVSIFSLASARWAILSPSLPPINK